MVERYFDLIGVGFGPSNIALAAALDERHWTGTRIFIEARNSAIWQPDMLLDGSDIQNNPLRDFVTPRNPRSVYGFLNYLSVHGRLWEYLNLGVHFPLRKDYAQYVTWVARHFDKHVRYGEKVVAIDIRDGARVARPLFALRTAGGDSYVTPCLVLGHGRTPHIPDIFANCLGDRVFHLTRYLSATEKLRGERGLRRVAVVGGSQSAIEIVLDLRSRLPGVETINVMRGFGYRLKDTSPFSDKVYFPDFVDYFFALPYERKTTLSRSLRLTNYSTADADVIHRLYLALYEDKLDQCHRTQMVFNHEVVDAVVDQRAVQMTVREVNQGNVSDVVVDAVILATGFKDLGIGEMCERCPPMIDHLLPQLATSPQGFLQVGRDYSVSRSGADEIFPALYLNGLCEASHGFGDAGSFSLLSVRSWDIATSIDAKVSQWRSDPHNSIAAVVS